MAGLMVLSGSGLSLWQVRTLDASGEITKAYSRDMEAHGRDVRKVRALGQLEGLEWIENLREVIEGTEPDSVRESRACDRLPLTSWSDSRQRVVLLGDGKETHRILNPEELHTLRFSSHQAYLLVKHLDVCSCSRHVFRPRRGCSDSV